MHNRPNTKVTQASQHWQEGTKARARELTDNTSISNAREVCKTHWKHIRGGCAVHSRIAMHMQELRPSPFESLRKRFSADAEVGRSGALKA